MKNLKLFVYLFVSIVFIVSVHGQTPQSYFSTNILQLDPIEGVWNVEDNIYVKAGRAGRSSTETFSVTIKRSSGNNFICEGTSITLQRIGETNAYKLSYYSEISGSNQSVQIILESNGYSFSYSTRENASRWSDAYRTDSYRWIKNFPTASMYAEAKRNKIEEEIRRAEEAAKPTEWSGSGIAIGERYIATNNHVVADAKLVIQIPSVSKTAEYKVEVVATDTYNDLAILKVTDYKFNGFGNLPYGSKLSTSDLGEEVFVLGYPLVQTMGEDVKLTTGVVSAKTGFQGDVSQYQISAAVQPGNSGGPLFDYRGNLIGIVSSKHKGAENVGYAIKLNYLNTLAETTSERIVFPKNNTISTMSLAEKVKTITKYVVLIKANTSGTSSQTSGGNGLGHSTNVSASDKAEAGRLYESCRSKMQSQQPDVNGAYRDICRSVELYPTVQANKVKALIAAAYIGDMDGAYEASKYCIDNGEEDDTYRKIYADCLSQRENFNEAITQYSIIINNDRRNIGALYHRALCYDRIEQADKALADYQAAVKFDGVIEFRDYGTIYNNIAYWYITKNRFTEAAEPMKKALQKNHIDGYIWDSDGELKYKLGQYEDCIRSMTNAIVIANAEKETRWLENSYYYRGLARKALGQMADAYKDLEKAVEYGNEDAKKALAEIDASKIDFSETASFSRMVQSPSIKKNKSSSDTQILGVEMTSDFTALYCSYTNNKYDEGGWYSIDPNAYLRDKATGKKYICIATENCDFSPRQTSIAKDETKRFVLYFEALPESAQEIDFIESDQSSWQFYGISLK